MVQYSGGPCAVLAPVQVNNSHVTNVLLNTVIVFKMDLIHHGNLNEEMQCDNFCIAITVYYVKLIFVMCLYFYCRLLFYKNIFMRTD